MITMKAGTWINEYTGLSTDDKPVTHVPNGSTYYEMDTQDVYMFDATAESWLKQ